MQYIKNIIDILRYPEMYISKATIFVIKCIVVTMCISYLLAMFIPKYEFPDTEHRCNTITGRIERFSTWDGEWH